MSSVRSRVVRSISEKKEIWSQISVSNYILIQRDRIGKLGIEQREGIPGIWGHSYVRTYYNWIGAPPTKKVRMEGGIATSYYVLKSLKGYLSRLGVRFDPLILGEVATFLKERTTTAGIGIRTTTSRGTSKVDANLRHSCLGYLIMCELVPFAFPAKGELREAIHHVSSYILKPLSHEDLLNAWLSESWPIGGIASYIAARDHLFNTQYDKDWIQGEGRFWPAVRDRLLDALAGVSSERLYTLGLSRNADQKGFDEHMPFWHPIKSLSVLRLHSSLGCLSLVGQDIAKRSVGRNRIMGIVKALREQVLNSNDRAPRFAPESPPSFAAACAMLEMTLGSWYEPVEEDLEFILSLLSFMEHKWSNPDVYVDYWSEFAAPILNLEELHLALGKDIAFAAREADAILQEVTPEDERRRTKLSHQGLRTVSVLQRILPVALEGSQLVSS